MSAKRSSPNRLDGASLRDLLIAAAFVARQQAEPVGPQHGAWDFIGDAEAVLAGKRSILPTDQLAEMAEGYLLPDS